MPVPPSFPYILSIQVFNIDGTTPLKGASMKVLNVRTEDMITDVTESDGSVSYNLTSQFTNGYEDNDTLLISASKKLSEIAELFTLKRVAITGDNMNIVMTVGLHVRNQPVPFTVIAQQDMDRLSFEPNAKSLRVMQVDSNGDVVTPITEKFIKTASYTVTISGGSGSVVTGTELNNTLKQLIVTPTTSTTTWQLSMLHSDGTTFRKLPDSGTFTGWKQFTADFPLYGKVSFNFSSVSADENIAIKMVYV